MSEWLSRAGAESQIDNYPQLKALRDKVSKMPKIAEWMAKRPATNFWVSVRQQLERTDLYLLLWLVLIT